MARRKIQGGSRHKTKAFRSSQQEEAPPP